MTSITEMAIDRVRDNNPDFYKCALSFAMKFASQMMKPFSSEDVIEAFEKENEKARESRVWGAVMRELSRNNLIIFHGYQTYRNPKGHSKPSTVWISREYSEKQSLNRTANGKSQIKLEI